MAYASDNKPDSDHCSLEVIQIRARGSATRQEDTRTRWNDPDLLQPWRGGGPFKSQRGAGPRWADSVVGAELAVRGRGQSLGVAAMAAPVKVSVTGAAGRVAYSLLYSIANGEVYGREQPIVLALLDSPSMAEALAGLAMELQDCAFELLRGVTVTHREEVGFREADVALLLDSLPAQDGMQLADLLKANALRFRAHGRALDVYAKKTVKVLVVGDFANTNCLVSMISAPSIPSENFTCLARLDQNEGIQQQETAVIRARKLSSAAFVAKAICDHLRVWWSGTKQGEWVSMGVVSSRNGYGVPDGLIYSFPVAVQDGHWKIIPGLHLSPLLRQRMELSTQELLTQRDMILTILARSRL